MNIKIVIGNSPDDNASGMDNMTFLPESINGDFEVQANAGNTHTISGNVRVKSGVSFTNIGMIGGDVFVEAGASFRNIGMVQGNVLGEGHVEILGMVRGTVAPMLQAVIHGGAVVYGK